MVTMIAEVLGNSEVDYAEENLATIFVELSVPPRGKVITGGYNFNPLETEPPVFLKGQSIEVQGNFVGGSEFFKFTAYGFPDQDTAG